MAIPLSYNLRNIRQRPVSTLATAAGVAFVVAILIGAMAMAAGFQAALVSTGSPDNVIVLRKGADSEISSGLSREAGQIIKASPAVASQGGGRAQATGEMVVLINQPRLGQSGSSNVTIRGLDPDGMSFRKIQVTDGRMFTPGTDEVIVGKRIAGRFADCRIGDHLRFNQRSFTVVGHFSAAGSGFESEVWGDNAVLQPALNRDGYQSVTFHMRDPSQFAQVKKQMESDPRLGVDVRRERDWYASQSQLLAGVIRVAGVFITLIMAVGAVFGAMNTMYAAVGARTREIATLMVLGFAPGAIRASFVFESMVVSVIGGLAGCLIALPINAITTSTTNWTSFSEVAFAFRVTPTAMLFGLVFAAGIGIVGGFLPARRASKLPLAAALRAI